MSKKIPFLISFVLLLSLVGTASAATLTWDKDGGLGTRLWDDANCWDKTGPASAPTAGDTAVIDDLFTDDANGPIIQAGIDAACNILSMGNAALPAVGDAVLTMTGGTLTTGDNMSVAYDVAGSARFDLSAGDVNIAEDLFIAYDGTANGTVNMTGGTIIIGQDIEIAEYGNSSGTLNISAGTIDVADNIYVGWAQTGPAALNMTGGTVTSGTVTGGWFYIGGGYATNCYVNLDGGTLSIPDISIYPDNTLNIGGGTLIVDEDRVTANNGYIYDPCAADWAGNLATPGVVSVYGTDNYGIIDDANYSTELGKRAVLVIDYDGRNAGKTTVSAIAVDPNLAWNPDPPDDSPEVLPPGLILSWSAGDNAASHDVYLGTNFNDVNTDANTGGTFIANQELSDVNYAPSGLSWLKPYYWRIDEIKGNTTWKGPVWTFTTIGAKAREPNPDNGDTDVPFDTVLNWIPGAQAVTHQLYFSTDFAEVNERSIAYASPPANSYTPPPMLFGTTYYWAVDEVNNAEDPNVWYGDVWEFSTPSHLDVDSFNSYAADFELWAVWKDMFELSAGRAQIDIETDLGYDGNSMIYDYDNYLANKGKYHSRADALIADLEIGPDWTTGGAKALWLVFYGTAGNATTVNDKMYIALNDGAAVSYYPDVNDINEESWHEWHIDLEDFNSLGIDLTSVSKISIGFGTYGGGGAAFQGGLGGGIVYFDRLELWPSYCRSELLAGDVSGNCVVNYYDVEIMANDWLIQDYNFIAELPSDVNLIGWWKLDEGDPCEFTEDSSIYGNDGNIIEATWTIGYPNDPCDSALQFDGDGVVRFDHVACAIRDGNNPGIYPAELMPDTFTVSCWTRLDSFAYFSSFVGNGMDTGSDECGFFFYNYGWNEPDGSDFGLAIRTETAMSYVETENIYETDRWYHLAATYDGTYATVYVDGLLAAGPTDVGGPMRWISADSNNHPENFTIGAWIDPGYDLHVDGIIDEVRYYDYPMNQGEIAILSEIVTPGSNVYQPVPSLANIADPEIELERKVNFVDFAVLGDNWLVEQLWP
ncbi:MAG: LamG-like jellyroll fold domain-containing protein [Planctomycetota bacterium]|jgi:hypothetical protein